MQCANPPCLNHLGRMFLPSLQRYKNLITSTRCCIAHSCFTLFRNNCKVVWSNAMRAEKSQRRGEQQSVPMVVWYVWYVFYRLTIQNNNQNNLKLCNTTTGMRRRCSPSRTMDECLDPSRKIHLMLYPAQQSSIHDCGTIDDQELVRDRNKSKVDCLY